MLDAFTGEWVIKENTGSTIRTILSIDEISSLLFSGRSEARREFGLVILCLSVSDDVPVEIVPVLQKVFRDLFEDATFAIRVSIAKLFLQNLPVMDAQLCKLSLPTKIGNRIRYCIDEMPMEFDDGRYAAQLELFDQLFQREDLDLLDVSLEKHNEEISE
jgi:hypothetical protein